MRDYLNSIEKNQFMVLQSVTQLMDGLRNSGVDGPKIESMLEEWKKRDNITKDEHKNLKTVNRDIKDKMQYAVMPRQQFYDWCVDIMEVKCNGCTKDWNTCDLHQVFENNFVPESGFDCSNCKFAYQVG
jgi:hypothetical protein